LRDLAAGLAARIAISIRGMAATPAQTASVAPGVVPGSARMRLDDAKPSRTNLPIENRQSRRFLDAAGQCWIVKWW
jgi:hypothetical protein